MMKRNQTFADERTGKKSKTMSDKKQTIFLPSIIPAELISQILAFLKWLEYRKLVFLNREWHTKIWSHFTLFTITDISATKNGLIMDQLVKNVSSLEVRHFEQNNDYTPKVEWLGKFTNLRHLTLEAPILGAIERIAPIVPSLTSLTVDYITQYYEFLNMTNLRALSVRSDEDFSIMKGLVKMRKLNTLQINAASSSTYQHFHYVSKLTNLTHLTLQYCKITEDDFLYLAALTNLKELVLDSGYFVDESGEQQEIAKSVGELTALRDLEVLEMENMSVGENDLVEFKKLTRLTVEDMPLSFELPPNLKSLQCRFMNDTFDKYIDKFINLESLEIRLEDDEMNEAFESISKLQQLTNLKIMAEFDKNVQKGLKGLTLLPRLKVLKFWITIRDNITADTIFQTISQIPSLTRFHCNRKEYLDSIREKVPHMLCL